MVSGLRTARAAVKGLATQQLWVRDAEEGRENIIKLFSVSFVIILQHWLPKNLCIRRFVSILLCFAVWLKRQNPKSKNKYMSN